MGALFTVTALAVPCAIVGAFVAAGHDEQDPAPSVGPVLELIGGKVFDGTGFREQVLYVEDGRFVDTRPDGDVKRMDLAGAYVVPPFADAHTHRFASERDAAETRAMYLERGFLYVANLCGPSAAREATARWANSDDGLDVLFTNGAITATGAHPVPLYRSLHARRGRSADTFLAENEDDVFYQVDDARSLDAKLDLLFATGPDLVKFMLSSSLDPDLVPGLVERAHDEGLRVVCHLDTAEQFRVAVRAGVDVLAHAPGYGVRVGEDLDAHRIGYADAEMAATRGLAVVATAGAYEHRSDNSAARDVLGHNLDLLLGAGVPIAFGSDDWAGPDTELRALQALDLFSDLELLVVLCETTPRLLYPDRRIGRLAPGYEASFVVLGESPLEGLSPLGPSSVEDTAFQRPLVVVKQGAVVLDRRAR